MLACNVFLVRSGSDWALSAPRPPHSPLLLLPGSQTHCHSFHVRFLLLPQARRPFIPPQRKWPVLFRGTLARARMNFWHDRFSRLRTSACKVQLRTCSYHWRDLEVSTTLLYLTMFMLSCLGTFDWHSENWTISTSAIQNLQKFLTTWGRLTAGTVSFKMYIHLVAPFVLLHLESKRETRLLTKKWKTNCIQNI